MAVNNDLFYQIISLINNQKKIKSYIPADLLELCQYICDKKAKNDQTFRIVFCGVFSSGKTSLINGLIGNQVKLPVGINPVTKIATKIVYGEKITCFCQKGNETVSIPPETLSDIICREINIDEIEEIKITIPSPFLENRIELIDTPGFDDEIEGRLEMISKREMERADMVVLCCNALVLGKIVEREIIKELDEKVGHYCLVVTRMDNLETDEDKAATLNKARWLMKNRGNNADIKLAGTVFPIVAAGEKKDISSIQNHLWQIIQYDPLFKKIAQETDRLRRLHCLNELLQYCEQCGADITKEYEELLEINVKSKNEKSIALLARRSYLLRSIEEGRAIIKGYCHKYIKDYEKYIKMNCCYPDTFQKEANDYAIQIINRLIDDISQYSQQRNIIALDETRICLHNDVSDHHFSVPAPEGRWVLRRGMLDRSVMTMINFIFFDFSVDDGYDFEYNDFQAAAVNALIDGPMKWIVEKWVNVIMRVVNSIDIDDIEGGYEDYLNQLQETKSICSNLASMIAGQRKIEMTRGVNG